MSAVLLALRRRLVSARRTAQDLATGRAGRYARAGSGILVAGEPRLMLSEPVRTSEHAEAKRHNIAHAARAVNAVVIAPDRLFSFWRIVGRPNAARGFQQGRSLVAGRLELDYGGGLCQLAGMIYHLALRAGLDIVERHPHSRDIYTEQERYTPLGADAAVAYGLKDLRLCNRYPFPVALRVTVGEATVSVELLAPQPMAERTVEFVRLPAPQGRRYVETWLVGNAERTRLAISQYIIADGTVDADGAVGPEEAVASVGAIVAEHAPDPEHFEHAA